MTIRDATRSDSASLAAISIEVWVGTSLRRGVGPVFADYVLRAYTPERMRALIANPAQIMVVSDNEEGPDGYVRITPEVDPPLPACRGAEIATLYVQPCQHGRGIGRALLRDAFSRCRARGIGSVWLTTNAENAPAIAFYHRMGFRVVGRTDFMIDGMGYPNEVLCLDLANAQGQPQTDDEPTRI
ncbi:MAG: GNAT family N-acetyltransferase [Pseudomonadota bacterium]